MGMAMPHGDCPSVGLAGHSLHGGFGYTSRMWGLSTDAIVGMDVVTADGRVQYASRSKNKDLFWVSDLDVHFLVSCYIFASGFLHAGL
jgi:FAD/FMN-containing dehydrogenase